MAEEKGRKKSRIKYILISIYMWFTMLIISILFIPWTVAFLLPFPLFDRHRKLQLFIHRTWCNMIARIYPMWKFVHHGFDRVDRRRNYVIMSNHQSFADILLLSFLPGSFRWVSKRSIFVFPIFGWQFWLGGHLSIKRGSEKSRKKFMKRAIKTLQSGLSVLIFPEGTRSKTGQIGQFKRGGFIMAVKTGVPILPVVISGSREALPKNSWIMETKTYPVVKVLEPVETKGLEEKDIDELMDRVRDIMIKAKKQTDEESCRLLEAWTNK